MVHNYSPNELIRSAFVKSFSDFDILESVATCTCHVTVYVNVEEIGLTKFHA